MTEYEADLIWHYTDGAALMNILANNELWAGSAAFMNDTNELLSGSIQLRKHFEDQQASLPDAVINGLEEYIPEVRDRSRHSFVLSASSDGDSLTMWRYYGRDQVSFAIGLDRKESLVPLARLKGDSHPHPPTGYLDDMYEKEEDGQIATFPDGSPIVIFDPDSIIIEGGDWKPVVYDPAVQAEIIAEMFEKLLEGVEKRSSAAEPGRHWLWLYPYIMNESLDLIKNEGFRDEREERIIVWPNPSWKFVFHRPGPFGLVPYVKLTSLGGDNDDVHEDRFATESGRLPIREIRIGPTPYSSEAAGSLKQLLSFHGLHDVKVSYSEIPFRQ
ncbi:hypothetical protein V1638_13715 [Pseudarthrobacter sp. J64]|uniref:hypothetical protein n=1 Tax=Pseudarthrobacter sp. J64 TaxID=3116485 RepID=UPI002E80CC99|nr:hypothetical protein [Pseudarthrobacter sp. J64]MEE2570444.1 hypothetical protein [Pseudarthrobacter sp. J64]